MNGMELINIFAVIASYYIVETGLLLNVLINCKILYLSLSRLTLSLHLFIHYSITHKKYDTCLLGFY